MHELAWVLLYSSIKYSANLLVHAEHPFKIPCAAQEGIAQELSVRQVRSFSRALAN